MQSRTYLNKDDLSWPQSIPGITSDAIECSIFLQEGLNVNTIRHGYDNAFPNDKYHWKFKAKIEEVGCHWGDMEACIVGGRDQWCCLCDDNLPFLIVLTNFGEVELETLGRADEVDSQKSPIYKSQNDEDVVVQDGRGQSEVLCDISDHKEICGIDNLEYCECYAHMQGGRLLPSTVPESVFDEVVVQHCFSDGGFSFCLGEIHAIDDPDAEAPNSETA